jgi:hypothetical protein
MFSKLILVLKALKTGGEVGANEILYVWWVKIIGPKEKSFEERNEIAVHDV